MVNNESQSLDMVFHALADSTRRELLKMVAQKECTIGELADPFKMTLAAVSKHIKVLEKAGLLSRTRDGRIHRCNMNYLPLESAIKAIDYYKLFWSERFNHLEKFLQESTKRK